MEVSVKKSNSSNIAEKSGSCDLESVPVDKPKDSARNSKGLKRSRGSVPVDSRRKRIKKESSLSSLGRSGSVSDNVLNFGYDIPLALLRKKYNQTKNAKSLDNSNGLSDDVVVPKRQQDFSRQRNIQTPVDSEIVEESLSCSKEDKKEAKDNARPIDSSKKKNKSNTVKENGSRDKSFNNNKKKKSFASIRHDHFENEAHLNDVDVKIYGEERQSKHQTSVVSEIAKEGSSCGRVDKRKAKLYEMPTESGKRKNKANGVIENGSRGRSFDCNKRKKASASVRQDHLHEAHLADVDEKHSGEESDVGNLEENAARMLSSLRFDTRCTGFSVDMIASSSEPVNGFHGNFTSSRPGSSSVDVAGRMLRPRRCSGKYAVRKRRHFYEVCSRDIDPYLILHQRIRVFWPLDKSWYFGLVKDYNPLTRLHHVKYDDREEEWIDLLQERVKLLLFPSEISGKFHSEVSQLGWREEDNKEGDQSASDGSCLGNFTESEPIISWLTRSKDRRKLYSSIIKKHRKTNMLNECKSSIVLEQESATVSPSTALSELAETLPEVLEVKSRTSTCEAKIPFVYFRRRFRKRGDISNKIVEEDYIRGSLTGSSSTVASAADCTNVLKEINSFSKSVELKHITMKISLRPISISDLVLGAKSFSLFKTFFPLPFGMLIQLWPMVRMEIVLVDNILGLRLLLFEGSLISVVGLLCSVITVFYRHNKERTLAELQMPCTSIGFMLSGLHDQGAQLLFVLYSFLQLEILNWRCLEYELKQQCLTMWELSTIDCNHFNIKNLLGKGNQELGTAIYKNAVSVEAFPGRSFSNIMHKILSDNSAGLNMYPSSFLIDESYMTTRTRSLSFATSSSLFMGLHMKLLIEGNSASSSIQKTVASSSQECTNNCSKLTTNEFSPADDPSDQASDITIENSGLLSQDVALPGKRDVHLKVETDALSFSSDVRSADKILGSDIDTIGNSNGSSDLGLNESGETVVRIERSLGHADSWQVAEKSCSSHPNGSSSPEKSEGEFNPCLNNASAQSQHLGLVEEQLGDKVAKDLHRASDLAWELNDYAVPCTNPTAPRKHHSRHNSISPTFSHWSNFWSNELMQNGFNSGSKKPRTQVSYSFPQSHQRKTWSYKKGKTVNANRVSGGSASARNNHEPLTCDANVLVTVGDRGWRDCGALIVLDSRDQEWRICVKLSGSTKYEYKVQHILQLGITNRYTHAMMWKGDKDWTLEFTDRSQWSLFKEIHEECYNHNIRAAYVKNIPIPGVRLIADADDNIVEVPFVRSPKYYRQVGTDVDMALDPSHVLYDMDSNDEEWISEMRNSLDKDGSEMSELTDDMFERVMDTFEKVAYAQKCDEFSIGEIEEFMADVGQLEMIKAIYERWRQKRLENTLPLLRQFQPPLWMIYEQQLRDWELSKSKMYSSRDGLLDKACSAMKPTMFAFCLRPHGLEIPNKGPKQRSHRKLMSAGCHRSLVRGHDGFHASGRRPNGLSVGEKAMAAIPSYESSDSYYSEDSSKKCGYPRFYRNNSIDRAMFPSPRDSSTIPCTHNKKVKRDGVYESSFHQVQDGLHRRRPDIDEFRLRDASSAAKHALNMAKLKRERAQWLLHKADLAIHKATSALIIADAIKESENTTL